MNKQMMYLFMLFTAPCNALVAMDTPDAATRELREKIVRSAALKNTFEISSASEEQKSKYPQYFPAGANHAYWTCKDAGIAIPATPQEQYKQSIRCKPKELQRGDLLFLATKEDPTKIIASFIYWQTINGLMIGNPLPGLTPSSLIKFDPNGAFIFSIADNLKPLNQIESGEQVGPYVVYGGTFIP